LKYEAHHTGLLQEVAERGTKALNAIFHGNPKIFIPKDFAKEKNTFSFISLSVWAETKIKIL
jgi:hypothetical protein